MKPYGIVLVGCGIVGGGAAVILTRDIVEINKRTGLNLALKKIVDLKWDNALKLGIPETLLSKDLDQALADPEVEVVIEAVGGLTFAKTVFEKALKAGKHVVSANKALLATFGPELFALARSQGKSIGLEASCAGGIPVIRTITESLLANRIDGIYGIVNGTCNFILSEMVQKGLAYTSTLKQAQELGYAEADPTLDVSGMDSAHKITILASLAFAQTVSLDQVSVTGIQDLDLRDTAQARDWGFNFKLLASAERQEDGLTIQVRPTLVSADTQMGNVWGSFNGLSIYGSNLGHSFYYGRGAGALPTASAVVSDVIALASGLIPTTQSTFQIWPGQTPKAHGVNPGSIAKPGYLRFTLDSPSQDKGVRQALESAGVSIEKAAVLKDNSYVLLTRAMEEDTLRAEGEKAASGLKENSMIYHPVFPGRIEFPTK